MHGRSRIPGPLGVYTETHGTQPSRVAQAVAATHPPGPVGVSSFTLPMDWVGEAIGAVKQLVDDLTLTFADKIRDWPNHFPTPIDTTIPVHLWEAGLNSLQSHIDEPRLVIPNIVTLVDFDMRSNEDRMWVLNLEDGTTLYNVKVSHGSGIVGGVHNGRLLCTHVSNVEETLLSSLGGCATALRSRFTRAGSRGHTVRRIALDIHGLDPTNDNLFDRNVIFHGAWYVNPNSAGRSNGCFATEDHINDQIVPDIVGGSFVYAHKE